LYPNKLLLKDTLKVDIIT